MIKKETIFIYIIFNYNNIFFLVINENKKILFKYTLGQCKTKGLKKINLNSIKTSLNLINKFVINKNCNIHLKLKGIQKNKKIVLKYIKQLHIQYMSISDTSLIIHNGCRKKKNRKL